MRKLLVLLAVLVMGSFFAGCAESPMIEASDGTVPDEIVVEFTFPGSGDYTVKRALSPLPTDTWTQVYSGPNNEFTDDTAEADTIYFYTVSREGATSWPNGGYHGTVPTDPEGALKEKLKLWERANGCIHNLTNVLHPDPASELPIEETIPGDTGTMLLQMDLVAGEDLQAVAQFTWAGFSDTCTNGYTMSGYQYAPVDVVNYDGVLRGYVAWDDGWQVYECVVTAKNTTGGHWYAYDGGVKTKFTYPVQPEGVCTDECDASCCPE